MIKYILIFSYLINIIGKYILSPFDSFVYNPKNNFMIKRDVLSSRYKEDIYFNLSIGTPKQDIKILIRLDQYELKTKEPEYISSLSKTFKSNQILERFICKDNFYIYFMTINTSKELNDFIKYGKKYKEKKEKEMIKEYKNVTFVYFNDTTNNKYIENELSEYEINMLFKNNFGMLGLR